MFRKQMSSVLLMCLKLNFMFTNAETSSHERTARGVQQLPPRISNNEVECGVPDVTPNVFERIVGGTEAVPHSYPWQISLMLLSTAWRHFCGGSIISSTCILTAAHCVYNYDVGVLKVLVGGHDRNSTEGLMVFDVERTITHPDYTGKLTKWNDDIACIFVKGEIQFSSIAKPICIAHEEPNAGELKVATGWGKTAAGVDSNVLNQVILPIVLSKKCQNIYPTIITPGKICAGFEEGQRDTCQGDSGGPLAGFRSGKWYLYGITSVGSVCAKPNKPGIYTNVALYYDWIMTFIGDVDECKSAKTNLCSQVCHNTVGSYTCSCFDGYTLNSDGRTCAKDEICGDPSYLTNRRPSPSAATEAAPHSYPWLVSISWRWENWRHRCCGTIINQRWILTAANCLCDRQGEQIPAHETRLLVGAQRLDILEKTEQEFLADDTFVHPDFDYATLTNNIALVRLSEDIVYGKNARPACLPNVTAAMSSLAACRTVGWRTISKDATTVLFEKRAKILDSDDAGSVTVKLSSVQGKCSEDLGGPMFCLSNNHVVAVGLTNYACLQEESVASLTHVTKHLEWIENTLTTA